VNVEIRGWKFRKVEYGAMLAFENHASTHAQHPFGDHPVRRNPLRRRPHKHAQETGDATQTQCPAFRMVPDGCVHLPTLYAMRRVPSD
jgi:hypothetical protein